MTARGPRAPDAGRTAWCAGPNLCEVMPKLYRFGSRGEQEGTLTAETSSSRHD